MQLQTTRKFSVIQAMVLVAAIAPGLSMTRGLPEYLGIYEMIAINHTVATRSASGWGLSTPGPRFNTLGRPLKGRPSYWLGHIPYWAGPSLASLSLATAGLAILRPGDRPGRLADSPGSATGLAVAVALAAQAIRDLRFVTANGSSLTKFLNHHEAFTSDFWIGLPRTAGYTVAIWWLAMALGGRWSREPGVGGSLGRALGWCWMAMAASSEVGLWCYALNC